MTNAELFKKIFGIYAEEFWAYPKEEMLDWITSDAPSTDAGDLISRRAAIDLIHKTIYGFFDIVDNESEEPMSEKDKLLLEVNKVVSNGIKDLPSAQDVVEVVRCKDCKYYNHQHHYCDGIGYWFGLEDEWGDNGFCYKGERREDANKID